ncbi:hypothetical protein, partial [Neisseria sicca]|uniref:hypothetical protein n=1 Tax=Neisseria sicca TaxID=490 RepID=UPI001C997592
MAEKEGREDVEGDDGVVSGDGKDGGVGGVEGCGEVEEFVFEEMREGRRRNGVFVRVGWKAAEEVFGVVLLDKGNLIV